MRVYSVGFFSVSYNKVATWYTLLTVYHLYPYKIV